MQQPTPWRTIMKCPGQDMQYWNEEAIFEVQCPKCDSNVEFYKDDTTRKCGNCGNRFINPKMDFGCASYCQFAEQCLGTLPEEFKQGQDNLLKDKVAVAVKRHYGSDFKSISSTIKIAKNAENIGKSEGANLPIVLCVAYLHKIDVPLAKSILEKLTTNEIIIGEVCNVLKDLEKKTVSSSTASNIIGDAVSLYHLQEEIKSKSAETQNENNFSPQTFTTESAITLAKEMVQQMV